MPKPKRQQLARRRTPIPVTGTTGATKASLDHASALALHWAATWASLHLNGRRVPTSAVLRRALVAYVERVEALGTDIAANRIEALRLASAGTAFADPGAQDFEGSLRLLSEVKRGAPMPGFEGLVRPALEVTPWIAELRTQRVAPPPMTGDPRPRSEDHAPPGPQFGRQAP